VLVWAEGADAGQASQRDDGATERPSHLTGGAAGEVMAALLAEDMAATMKETGWQ
jgi:hypothetical protein